MKKKNMKPGMWLKNKRSRNTGEVWVGKRKKGKLRGGAEHIQVRTTRSIGPGGSKIKYEYPLWKIKNVRQY
jgi:hypothetical protein